MGSVGFDDSSQKAIEPELVDVGIKLLSHPSSIDELLMLLNKAESLLAKVWQRPPRSTCRALFQIMKALVTEELLHNDNSNVQIAVASCCNELTRITAPEFPYDDDTMRVIFNLFMIAFEQLACESGSNYYRALHIVDTITKVRSCLMLLDVDNDELAVEMFQLFLKNIGSNHPSDVFEHMEMIMTLVIEEIDEISFELLRPLLASVKMRNKDISPVSWELGKKVLENCKTKLQRHLQEAVKEMNLEVDDYAEIVACICRGTSDDNSMVSTEVSPTAAGAASQTDRTSKTVHETCSPQTDDGNVTKLDSENLLETLKDSHQIIRSETEKGTLQKRRRRKPSSVIRPEEDDESTLKTGDRYSHEESPGYDEEKEDFALASEQGNSSMLSNSLRKKTDYFSEISLSKNFHPKKKKSMINQHKGLDLSLLKRKILKPERGYDASKKTGRKAIAGSSKMRMEKEGGVNGDKSREGKHQLSPHEPSGRKDSHKYMEEFPMSRPARASLEKEKPRRPCIDVGLVNLRIQVWWPMDEVFYAGTVKSFDPETKKHTIVYDDGETEILNLRKENWKLFGNAQPSQSLQKRESDHPSPSRELIKSKEKNTKRKAGTSKKQQQHQHGVSSSKRPKGENRSFSKSGDNSSSGIHLVLSESEETCETNVSAKDEGENHVSKEEPEMVIKKTERESKRMLDFDI